MACLRWGTLLSAVLCLFAQENSWECLDKGEIVRETSKDDELPSVCVLSCTALTYRQIVERQQKLTVRFRDSQPGESDDFCWFIQSRCSTWDEVFVLLSISEPVQAEKRIELQINSLTHSNLVQPHESPSVLSDDCGLRFHVTPQLEHLQEHALCVRLKGIMGNRLQCPPFLAIVRKKTE